MGKLPSFLFNFSFKRLPLHYRLVSSYPYREQNGQSARNQPLVILDTSELNFKPETLNRLTLQPKLKSDVVPLQSLKEKSINSYSLEFIDHRVVKVKGGRGGDGMICFLHLYKNPNAGPSGGDGGNGGHVIFEATTNMNSLNQIKSSYCGKNGENGMHKDMHGASAEHTVIKVPVGTLVRNVNNKKLLADLNVDGIKFLAARGGSGGKGNHYFLSNTNRHPFVAEKGANGGEEKYILELQLIAHAGLLGFPNAGKSTLLKAISRARPKVASYPFTTLKPIVGIVPFSDGKQLAIADLPGIIEGAHQNRGLGITFLRHIERCVCLFYVIDISVSDPYEQFLILMNELKSYKEELSKRPVAIIINKIDVEDAEKKLVDFYERLKMDNHSRLVIIPISAKYNLNLTNFLLHFKHIFDTNRFEMEKNCDDLF